MIKLKTNNLKKHAPKIIIGVVALLIIGFFTRVSVWEYGYVKAKTGTERVAPVEVHPENGVSDDRVTEVKPSDGEYKVAPDMPRYFSIEKLGIKNARITQVGIKPDGSMGAPYNIYDVGWYVYSSKPGQGGTAILDGHNGGPTMSGVFKRLPTLQNGDVIEIERGDGARFKYSVAESYIVPLTEADKHMAKMQESPTQGQESISIITCTGEWSQPRRTYLSRQFLRAVLQK